MAARRHWRFTVRDQYGFVVQNAKVFVYQPGTTTDFTGTCHDAASGGNVLTNPFTSNSQGEVEGWFDNAQVVDVLVTDNTDQAYRAVSPTLPISFTSFTEKDDIYVSASDQGDFPHGASSHTDITRNIFLKAEDATLGTGTAFLNVGSGLNISRTVEYSDAASEDASWTFQIPDDWASGAITIQPVWSPGSTDGTAHTVRYVYTTKNLASGTDVTAAGTAVTWTGASAARTVNILVFDTATSTTVTPAAAGNLMLFNLQRLGSDGADTYVGTVRIHGLIVSYTANQ
jgi:hypothetical protein